MLAQEAEFLTLAGFMRNRKSFAEIGPQLTPESFTESDTRAMFEAMQSAGDHFTVPELSTELEGQGGKAFVMDVYNCWRRLGADKTFPVKDVERYARVVDRAGRLHQIELVIDTAKKTLGQKKVNAPELVSGLVKNLVDIEFSTADQQGFREYDFYLSEYVNYLKRILRGEPPVDRTPTGMRSVDLSLGGGIPNDLVIIGGMPGSGKTQLALEWAINVATHLRDEGEVGIVAINSAEMLGMALASRSIQSAAGIDSSVLRVGGYNKDRAALLRIRKELLKQKGLPLYIDDSTFLTGNIIQARISALRARFKKVVLVVTDFAELINEKGESVEQRVSRVFVNSKLLSKMLKCPVILLSQLARRIDQTGTRVPSMRDLRYSGMAEAVGGLIVLIYNPGYYITQGIKITSHPQMPALDGVAYLIVPKHRDGPTGFLPMGWEAKIARWSNLGPKVKKLREYVTEQ